MPEAYVYIHLEDGPVPAGVLETIGSGREETARFRYGRRYLQRKDRLTIDPIQLPLPDEDPDRLYTAPEDFVLFNGIRDAAPDGWGRHLMDRAAGTRPLSEFDYLVATGDARVGALAFGPDLSGPRRIVQWAEPNVDGEGLDLEAMLEAVQDVDVADDLPRKHARFLSRGSSLGGARPKATTEYDGKQWIAKFGRADDQLPMCRAEYAAMKLAHLAGLTVPPVRIERVLGQDIYLIERFDRTPNGATYFRIPFISGLTITGAHESESSRQSYRRLAEQLRLFGSDPVKDSKELWLRMVFNILCNNTDDHLRNHGFLWDGKGWRLSPAYDIVPYPQVSLERDLAIGVGRNGRQATLKNALSDAASFGLHALQAIALVADAQKKVKANWEALFKDSGITGTELERLRTCFIACDEQIQQPKLDAI
ncbi:MAG TPA: type II toxin-antitoxin system HipA family toxin [Candidatus Saccharimonadales bacterium]|nr:type II toxin-antitoxin system HipA family toxin [Candidatus Saccharimonadales bacterium]